MERLTDEQRAMVEANLGLCGWAVQRWGKGLPPEGSAGYTQADAFQDAVFGLARAAQLFDPSKGFTFSTYAATWIHQTMDRGRGAYEGRNFRRLREGRATDQDLAPVGSLDAVVGDGLEVGGLLSDPDDTPEAEARVLVEHIRSLADRVCRDDLDRDLLAAITDPNDHRAPTTMCGQVGEAHGVSRPAAVRRLTMLRERIAYRLGDVA